MPGKEVCPAERLAKEAGVRLTWADISKEEYVAILHKTLAAIRRYDARKPTSPWQRRWLSPTPTADYDVIGGVYVPTMRSLVQPYKAEAEED